MLKDAIAIRRGNRLILTLDLDESLMSKEVLTGLNTDILCHVSIDVKDFTPLETNPNLPQGNSIGTLFMLSLKELFSDNGINKYVECVNKTRKDNLINQYLQINL